MPIDQLVKYLNDRGAAVTTNPSPGGAVYEVIVSHGDTTIVALYVERTGAFSHGVMACGDDPQLNIGIPSLRALVAALGLDVKENAA